MILFLVFYHFESFESPGITSEIVTFEPHDQSFWFVVYVVVVAIIILYPDSCLTFYLDMT